MAALTQAAHTRLPLAQRVRSTQSARVATAHPRLTTNRRTQVTAVEPGSVFGKVGRILSKGDVGKVFTGVSRTRENLGVVDELLGLWKLEDYEDTLDELEEILLVSDFGPRTSQRLVDTLRDEIIAGTLKDGSDIKRRLKEQIMVMLTKDVPSNELNLGTEKPASMMIVGVNGSGKTTTIGKLSYKFKQEGLSVLLAAGDTFRAAAGEQLEGWAARSDCEVVRDDSKTVAEVLYMAGVKAKEEEVDVLITDTAGRLQTNFNLMDELSTARKEVERGLGKAPQEVLLVLDGTTGLNMLNQAREFNECVGLTGLIITKLDGTARGGCTVSVVDELKLPVKFVGVGETVDDLQPFDPASFVDALFPDN